jgi:osmoprotectant transport system permease protein
MNWQGWMDFVAARSGELWLRTGEHIMLTGVSTLAAVLLGIPLGIFVFRNAWARGGTLGLAGILQTIPSLAMLVLLLALFQRIGLAPALVALTLYALLPIVRNTLTGLQGVSPEVMEAARGIGMTEGQQLWIVRFPLALEVILAGVRTAAVIGVGIATLSAFIGAGGLGQFINRGLALANTPLILLGAVPAALLALVVDASLAAVQWANQVRPRAKREPKLQPLRLAALAAPFALLMIGAVVWVFSVLGSPASQNTVRIATKNFTEQLLLGEMMAQLIEARTSLDVERRFNLGGTMLAHGALVNGEVDIYPEYTGTALTAILNRPVVADPGEALAIVRRAYRNRFGAEWLEPFGFNNTYAITVREAQSQRRGWRRISDLEPAAASLTAGFTPEFSERPDGYPGLEKAYGFGFGEVVDIDVGVMYEAIASKQVDVIAAFATDGRIQAFRLKTLEDDKGLFPPYNAAPVVRQEALKRHPVLREVLGALAGRVDNPTMQRLNFEVDEKGRVPRAVAREFLESAGLLPAP